MKSPQEVALEVMSFYREFGSINYGERCSVNSHSFQAGLIAKKKGLDEEMILAAFLHDIGHLTPILMQETEVGRMGEFGMEQHDLIGEEFLKNNGFSPKVLATVRNHVDAKRYLCFAEEGYFEQLSAASKETMLYQGGPMDEEQAKAFEQVPFFEESIQIRKIDEEAKGIDFEIEEESWEYFHQLIIDSLSA
ncbi:MAG: HD domain-containing protein [Bacteroidota bacterium]